MSTQTRYCILNYSTSAQSVSGLMLWLQGRGKEADPTSTEGLAVLGSLWSRSTLRKWLTGQIDLSFDSFTMQMPKAHCHSTVLPCAAQAFAFWISGLSWESVATEGLLSLWNQEGQCVPPKTFTAVRSCNLIWLFCEFRPLQRKMTLQFSRFCGTPCCRNLWSRNAQKGWIYIWVSRIAIAYAKTDMKTKCFRV